MRASAMMSKLVAETRSVRRFDEGRRVSAETLTALVDLARQTASAKNLQPLRYKVVAGEEACGKVFPLLGWAGSLPEWKGPEAGERPTGYVVVTLMRELASPWSLFDAGIACQTMALAAREAGLGCCMIASFNKERLAAASRLPDAVDPVIVMAFGHPVEVVRLEPVAEDGSIRYHRDEQGVHLVPKRSLEEILLA